MVKFFKRFFIFLFLLITSIILLLIVFEDDVVNFFKKEASKQLNTTIDTRISVSFWKTFPNVSIEMEHPIILDAVKGSKDTLLVADELYLSFDIVKLFNNEFVINKINLEDGQLYLKVDEEGNTNYSILKSNKKDSSATSLTLALDKVTLENVRVHYINQSVSNNHDVFVDHAEADLILNDSLLEISILGQMHVYHIRVNNNDFIIDKELKLDAGCNFVFEEKKFHLDPSQVSINGMEFKIKGDVFNLTHSIDVAFQANKNHIKNIVSLLPKKVSEELKHYESKGRINFSGKIKGEYGKRRSPELNIVFGFDNVSITHPNTGKRIEHIYMNGEYDNGYKRCNATTHLKISNFKGVIDENNFKANLRVDNFDNPFLTLNLDAQVEVASLLEFYPIDGLSIINGRLDVNLDFRGKLQHLKNGDFLEKVYSKGSINLIDCAFRTKKDKLTYSNFVGECLFNNNSLGITNLSGKIGKSDFKTSGLFNNFFTYLLLGNKKLDIQADLVSDFIDLDELLAVSDTEKNNNSGGEELKYEFSINNLLNASCGIKVKALKFRELKGINIGKDIQGEFFVSKGKIMYSNVSGFLAGGSISMSGEIDASLDNQVMVHNYGNIKDFDVSRGFNIFENFGQIFLTDKNLKGKLDVKLSTTLPFDKHLKLDLTKLESTLNATITNGELNNFAQMAEMGKSLEKFKLLKYLKSKDFNHIKFDKMSNTIFIKNEMITIPQMQLGSSASSDITLNGTHRFDNEFDYNISFPLVNYKKKDRKIDKGISTKNDSDNLYVFVRVLGNPDDYKIDYDEKAILKSVVKQINPFRGARDVFKKDTVQISPDNLIELDEDTTEVFYLDEW